jgi:predicted acetyltransferase
MIKLVRPNRELRDKAIEFKQEFFSHDEKTINGSELLDQIDDYDEWLRAVTANTSPETVDPNWVVTDTFFALDENERIVGVIDLRHTLNDFLKDFGNSGYSVRPSERRKGYATEMLHRVIIAAKENGLKELHLSVERTNEPSIKTIKKNGGVYERSFEFENELADVYYLDTSVIQ